MLRISRNTWLKSQAGTNGGMPHLEMGRAVGDISRAPNGGLRADPSPGASESSFDQVHTSPQLVGAIVGAGRYWRLGGVPPGTDPPAACRT